MPDTHKKEPRTLCNVDRARLDIFPQLEPRDVLFVLPDSIRQPLAVPRAAGSISTVNGSSSCNLCSPGYYSPQAGATVCQSAPPGTFALFSGSIRYQICDQGTFTELPSQAACQPCEPGTITANFGSKSEGDCVSPRINFIAVR